MGQVYRFALAKKNLKVVFQNQDDCDTLCGLAKVPREKVAMIRGSGVDLGQYRLTPIPDGRPVIMLAARLLRDKGVMEFVAAAGALQQRGVRARFCLVGDIDPDNPGSLADGDIIALRDARVVEVWGFCSNMSEALSKATVVVLPSYYGEGLPKVLIEAAACGRPVVTTDHPGCRDAIEPGKTGLLVPVRNPAALAEAMTLLLEDPQRCVAMGRAGRELAEREFDVVQVVRRHLEIYRELEAGTA